MVSGIILSFVDGWYNVLGVVATTDVVEACTGVNIAIMVGGFPRKEGMERKDVMSKNVSIYKAQASALEKHAAANCKVTDRNWITYESFYNFSYYCNSRDFLPKSNAFYFFWVVMFERSDNWFFVFLLFQVLVVANPANTNALILKEFAPSIPEKNISCLTRLDHNRALGQISERLNVQVSDVKNVIIWGNHSSTQYPDVNHATVKLPSGEEKSVRELVADDAW